MNSAKRPIVTPALASIVLGGSVLLILGSIPELRTGFWVWIRLAFQIVFTVGMVVYLVRVVRKQRDDYWRERGEDPRHPEL